MSYNPKPLRELGAYWTSQGGVNLGVVGNKAHTVGYHLGRDRIFDGNGPGLGANDYSVQELRDKAGLSDAASAIDLGQLDGSLNQLYEFSKWLVSEAQAKKPGTGDIREVIYSPDGKKVQRYSGIDGEIHTGPGNGDDSHIRHTHISYFRDSENRDKVRVFKPYFTEEDMPGLKVTALKPFTGNVVVVGPGHSAVQVADREYIPVPDGQRRQAFATGLLEPPLDSNPGDRRSVYLIGSEAAILLAMDVRAEPTTGTPDDKHFVAIAVDGVIDKSSEILV